MNMTMQNFLGHTMRQQQAALNLARLANQEKDIDLNGNTINALLFQLTVRSLSLVYPTRGVLINSANSRETVRSS